MRDRGADNRRLFRCICRRRHRGISKRGDILSASSSLAEERREDHAIGRSRGRLSAKINAIVDEHGLPVRLMLTASQEHDTVAPPALLATPGRSERSKILRLGWG